MSVRTTHSTSFPWRHAATENRMIQMCRDICASGQDLVRMAPVPVVVSRTKPKPYHGSLIWLARTAKTNQPEARTASNAVECVE